MSTGLHWLASSERERQQSLELVRALQQPGTLNELGTGAIRDALSERLFPGTSTLQTRARYFLFVPWAYETALRASGSSSLASRVRAAEARLIGAIKSGSGDRRGLIGVDAGADLKRMPSALYWQGLRTWGIRMVGGPQSVIDNRFVSPSTLIRDDDGEALDGSSERLWHASLPESPADHPDGADFALTFEEADFLAERLRTGPATKRSMLAELAGSAVEHRKVPEAWTHPELATLDASTRDALEQARRFSLLSHGAALLYNVILAEMDDRDEESLHRESMENWAARAARAADDLAAWDLDELWALTGAEAGHSTRRFVVGWQRLLTTKEPARLVDDQQARSLIARREQEVKGASARTANPKALRQWGGASGTASMDFRWSTARTLLDDIRAGLARADA